MRSTKSSVISTAAESIGEKVPIKKITNRDPSITKAQITRRILGRLASAAGRGRFGEGGDLGSLNRHHGILGLLSMEGYMPKNQSDWMIGFLQARPEIKKIAEIGFNGGHSACTFLQARSDITVVSFDLGEHTYLQKARRFINKRFPNRHELIIGDSKATVPEFRVANPDEKFDLVFIDGGHSFEDAAADIKNFRELVAQNGVVIFDDFSPTMATGTEAREAWDAAVSGGVIEQEGVAAVSNRAWAIGRYQ
jgi:predicted O-methyltransferase YrrM